MNTLGSRLQGRRLGVIQRSSVHSHGLGTAEYTSDQSLAALLDRYPAELIDVNQYSYNAEGQVSLMAGERGQVSGAEMVEAVRKGRIWINLRKIETVWPEFWDDASVAFNDVVQAYEDMDVVKRSGQLIISSPGTRVPYHFDAAGVVLFHMRGIKRMFVYPSDEEHLPELSMEGIVARRTTEELPYRLDFEGAAEVFELHPGEALAWPLFAPHRVENVDGLCVSLSMDYQTWESRAGSGTLYTHACLRERGLQPPAMHRLSGLSLMLRWAASVPLRRLKVMGDRIAEIPREFVVDAKSANGMRPLTKIKST